MVGAAEENFECFEGTVSFPLRDIYLELPEALLPQTKCSPDEGICYTGLTYSKGFQVVSFGCWPRQSYESLAWYGVPECKNEVFKIICQKCMLELFFNLFSCRSTSFFASVCQVFVINFFHNPKMTKSQS